MRALPRLILLAGLIPGTASAAATFFPHRGEPAILTGRGGTSLTRHGITVWTDGMPAHRFRVLGTIRDERTDTLLDGDAVTSARVAKLVLAQGGNAVLVGSVRTTPLAVRRGGVGGVFGTPSYSDQGDVLVRGVTTDLVVIGSAAGS